MREDFFKNLNISATIIKTMVAAVTFVVAVTMFFGDMRALPPRVTSLESRVAALELNYATGMTRIEVGLSSLQSDFNMIKQQITRIGMEKGLDK